MTVLTAPERRLRRRRRVRAKVRGTATRPRISVFRSNRGIFAQLIDDDAGRTVAAVNWTEPELRSLGPMEQATKAGELMAYRHGGFWHCMDTKRDHELLESLWAKGAPWVV